MLQVMCLRIKGIECKFVCLQLGNTIYVNFKVPGTFRHRSKSFDCATDRVPWTVSCVSLQKLCTFHSLLDKNALTSLSSDSFTHL